MKRFFKRLTMIGSIFLFFITVVPVIPLLILEPVYWLITGRSYFIDLFDLTGIDNHLKK
jgi:hypothetical protein